MANYKETILTNLRDRSFTSVLVGLAVWLVASQVILHFTSDVITNDNYCKQYFKAVEQYYICAKAVIINKYLTFLIPLALGLVAYYIIKRKKQQNV